MLLDEPLVLKQQALEQTFSGKRAQPALELVKGKPDIAFDEPLSVVDGSAVPVNLGVNPALTITALAEHAMSQVPVKASGDLVGSAAER